MKTILLFLIIAIAASDAIAQVHSDSTYTRKDVALAPSYKFAIGIRGVNSYNIIKIGLTGKYLLNKQSGLELGYSNNVLGNQASHITLFYERYLSLFNSPNFMIYYGAGSGVILLSNSFEANTTNGQEGIKAGIGFIGGLELGLGKGPLAISLDYYKLYYPGLKSQRRNDSMLDVPSFGIGIKYRL